MNIELTQLMQDFGGSQLSTARDIGLLSVESCRKRVLDIVDGNIKNYRDNSWNKGNQMQKLIIDAGRSRSGNIFSLRIGGKRLYRCSCNTPTTELKLEFLKRVRDLVQNQKMDDQIINFCEKEVNLAEARKEKQREKARAKRREALEIEKRNAEILRQAQSIVQRNAEMAIHTGSSIA